MKHSVYFASSCGKVKIGCSKNPEARIASIGEWIPFPVTLLATTPGSFALEAAIHQMFDEEWSHGEWFHATPRLLAFIDKVAAGEPLGIDCEARATRRRAFIADKKRLSRRLSGLGERRRSLLPSSVMERVWSVPKGEPIPPALLAEVNGELDRAYAA